MAERGRRHEQRLRERLGLVEPALAWAAAHGDRVAAGPLAGLRYPPELLRVADAPLRKLRGTYERPLHPALERAVAALRGRPGSVFVDAGCADGYYAVGVARAAGCASEAFDLARSARAATRALAAANGVDVRVRRRASERSLLALAPRAGALLCDVEGAEAAIVTERIARAYAGAVVVVELHGADALACVPPRFRATHACSLVESGPDAGEELRSEPTPWLVAEPLPG